MPPIPGDSGASTEPHVVDERRAWIEKFFEMAFELLDEKMQAREVGRSNDWETKFAVDTCVVRRLTLAASRHSTSTRAKRASAHETCGPSVGVSLKLKVDDARAWELQNAKNAPSRW